MNLSSITSRLPSLPFSFEDAKDTASKTTVRLGIAISVGIAPIVFKVAADVADHFLLKPVFSVTKDLIVEDSDIINTLCAAAITYQISRCVTIIRNKVKKQREMIDEFMNHYAPSNDLYMKIIKNKAVIKWLISSGADLSKRNQRGESLLDKIIKKKENAYLKSIFSSEFEIFKLLVQYGWPSSKNRQHKLVAQCIREKRDDFLEYLHTQGLIDSALDLNKNSAVFGED